MKIVFLDESTVTLGDIDFSRLKVLGEYSGYPNSDQEQVIERAVTAEAVITNKVPINKKVFRVLKKLKLVTVIATGYNNVDLETAAERGITVCNVPGYAFRSVPQHTFALILSLVTKVHLYNQDVKAGKWQKAAMFTLLTHPTFELAGKTIGIIGFGSIGRGVARIAEGFGMKVLAYDAYGIKEGKYPNTSLETIFREADVITVHCPLTEETRNLIDAEAISRLKKTALVINTARGGIIDEAALAEALNAGRIAGAGTDVLTQEPPKNGNPLLTAENTVITPHSAWSTVEARQRLVDETAENIKAFIAGKKRNVVV